MIIYKITNKINGKVYIGQTIKSLSSRFKTHLNEKYQKFAIHRAIEKYGKENFDIVQIDSAVTKEDLNKKEIYWISFYNSMNKDFGYNLKEGGNSSVLCEESRKKIAKTHLGKKYTTERKLNISNSLKGRRLSEEHKNNLSISHSQKKLSEDHKKKCTKHFQGKHDKCFTIIDPFGNVHFSGKCLKKWCDVNPDISYGYARVACRERKTLVRGIYTGYKFLYEEL